MKDLHYTQLCQVWEVLIACTDAAKRHAQPAVIKLQKGIQQSGICIDLSPSRPRWGIMHHLADLGHIRIAIKARGAATCQANEPCGQEQPCQCLSHPFLPLIGYAHAPGRLGPVIFPLRASWPGCRLSRTRAALTKA